MQSAQVFESWESVHVVLQMAYDDDENTIRSGSFNA